tara:strand:+ start:324 stop:785 length:462 start_codon:yes stop_codon:yes gene_type:complete
MAITTSICNSFLGELLNAEHDLNSHTIKMALIKPSMSGTYDDTTTSYDTVTSNSDEATGTNYSAGGQTLEGITITTSQTGDRAFVDIDNEVFSNVTTSARGCIIYNTSTTPANKAIAVFDFGSTISATAGDLTVTMPGPGTNGDAAVIRIANS